jgi:DNA helicase-2/ATP-dependent DNA helicase PcrA
MLEQFKKDSAGEVAPLARRIFVESGLEKSLKDAGEQGQNALENIGELINAAHSYDRQTEEPSLVDYLQQIALFSDVDTLDSSAECVALMTLHTAKGLEFENVFIVGLEDGLLPHEKSDSGEDEDELEEERRLFFVGMTRAKTGLYISYARYRTIRGQLSRTIPSQFLYELGTDFTGLAEESRYCYDNGDTVEVQDLEFERGQLVRHRTFGVGTVEEFIDMGENSVVVVRFNTGQTKTLMLKYADLSKDKSHR